MKDKTYQFDGFDVNGKQHVFEVRATSMKKAVAAFMRRTDRPAVFGWNVMSAAAQVRAYPVTRERWGHAYDGKD